MVEEVEEIGSQVKLIPLGDGDALDDGGVHVPVTGTEDNPRTGRPECVLRRLREHRSVKSKPSSNTRGLLATSTPGGATGVRLALKPDGSPDTEGLYSRNIHPSYPAIVPAALQMYDGDPDKGLDLMHRTWRNLVLNLKMVWDMPVGLGPDGEHRIGLEYYHNSMLWSYPAAVFGQTLRAGRIGGPGGARATRPMRRL